MFGSGASQCINKWDTSVLNMMWVNKYMLFSSLTWLVFFGEKKGKLNYKYVIFPDKDIILCKCMWLDKQQRRIYYRSCASSCSKLELLTCCKFFLFLVHWNSAATRFFPLVYSTKILWWVWIFIIVCQLTASTLENTQELPPWLKAYGHLTIL